jgi:hypothetical protein
MREQILRIADQPQIGKRNRSIGKIGRTSDDIDSKTDDAGKMPTGQLCALEQQPREFCAIDHKIIGPFDPDSPPGRPQTLHGAQNGEAGDKTKLRRKRNRTGIDKQKTGRQIALRRQPGATMAAAPLGLLMRCNPQRASLAIAGAAQGLIIR